MGLFKKWREVQDDDVMTEALEFILTGSKEKGFQWLDMGVAGYMHWIKNTATLSPEQDFQFIKEFMPIFWDIYRDTALNAIKSPTLSGDEAINLINRLHEVMRKFPPEYQGEEKEEKQFLIYLVACLDSLEKTQNVRLSNATVHMMLFIWAHSRIK